MENIHAILTGLGAQQAAARYAAVLDRVTLDVTLLGMGEDGHVASLLPDELPRAFDDASVFRPVISRHKPPPQRITMGYLSIAAAREVWVLVSGPGKRDALRKAVSLDPGMPLGRVLSSRSKTMVFTDFDPANWSASP